MPIYEFDCLNCGRRFDLLVLSESSFNQCPFCHHTRLKKCVSLSSFQLKGKDWYATHKKQIDPESHDQTQNKNTDVQRSSQSEKSEGSDKTGSDKTSQ